VISRLRALKPDDLGQRAELVILLRHAAGEVRRPAQRHDLPGVRKPLRDDGIVSATSRKSAAMLSRKLGGICGSPNNPPAVSIVNAG
jgi:hypothetical protein